jgi:tetratricopeptide (TPR) repeat protein
LPDAEREAWRAFWADVAALLKRAGDETFTRAWTHASRGIALVGQDRPAEALAAFDQALRLKPDLPSVHNLRGQVLGSLGRYTEAIDAYREAIRHQKDFAEAYCRLGLVLQATGELTEALDAFKRGRALGSKKPGWGWREQSKQWVADCERLVALEKKLPALLTGEEMPADAAEAAGCAKLCHYKGRYAAELRFYEAAFAADPKLADDLSRTYRYDAACAAALVGCG